MATQLNLGDLGKLKAQLVSVAAHWVDIADQLNMTLEVDIIKSNHYGVEERLRELLNRWLNREDPSPTLEALCQALRNDRAIIGGANMASKLEEEFKNSGGSGRGSGSTNPAAPFRSMMTSEDTWQPFLGSDFVDASLGDGSLDGSKGKNQQLQKGDMLEQPAPTTTQTRGGAADVTSKEGDERAVTHWGLERFHTEFKGASTLIAIVDSGINSEHHAFEGKIHRASKNFLADPPNNDITDRDGHGTRSAGIAAGLPLEGFPIGVAPEAQLLVCRVSIEADEPQTMIEALKYLVDLRKNGVPIDVVSVSLGYQLSLQQEKEVSKAVDTLVQDCNTIVVAAACNNGQQRDPIWYPAKCGNTISIGAHDHNKNRADFSPVGQRLDFLAPGVSILSSTKGTKGSKNATSQTSGTSCAAPAVAGLIALLIQCAREVGGPARTRISNHTVMMYLLRQMSSHEHSAERGYGALQPNSLLATLTRENAAEVLHAHIKEALNHRCDCEECEQKRTK